MHDGHLFMQPFSANIVAYISTMSPFIKFTLLIFTTLVEYIFPIFPGDTIVIFAGVLTAHGALDLVQVFGAILIGSIIGGWLTFSFGRYLVKNQTKNAWVFKFLTSDKIAKFQSWYQKWGYAFLLISRFIPGIRAFFFIAAGLSGLSLRLVLIFGTISSLIFNACLLFLGHTVGKNIDTLEKYWQNYSLIINLLILTIALVGLFIFFKGRIKP